MNVFDLVLNKLPIIKYLDGYKVMAAGVLAAVSCATHELSKITGPETAAILNQVSQYSSTIAGYLGAYGLVGKTAKIELRR